MSLPQDTTNSEWYYLDRTGQEFGPFKNDLMRAWYTQGLFKVGDQLLVRLDEWTHYVPVRQLYADGDAFLSGKSRDDARREASGGKVAASPSPAVLTPAPTAESGAGAATPRNRSRSAEAARRDSSRSRSRRRSPGRDARDGSQAIAPYGHGAHGSHPPAGYGAQPHPGYGAHYSAYPPSGYPGYPGYYAPPPHAYGQPHVIYAYGPPPSGYHHGGHPYAYGQPAAAPGDGRFFGRIKSFNTKNGFGFIDCPGAYSRYQRDVFIHKKWMSDLQVGEDISFLIETNKDRMPQARDVARTDGRPPWPSADGDSRGRKPVELKRRGESGGDPPAKRSKALSDGSSPAQPKQPSVADEERTTLMLKNLPNNCSRAELLKALSREGLQESCDFVYLPTSFRTWKCCGYAFVSLTTHEAAERAMKAMQGYEGLGARPGQRGLEVCWSVLQGLESHVERYRNSPVMHEEVPDECRPLRLKDGSPVPFPEPTKRLKAPRLRRTATGRESKASKSDTAGDDKEADFDADDDEPEDADAAEAEAAEALAAAGLDEDDDDDPTADDTVAAAEEPAAASIFPDLVIEVDKEGDPAP